jgi:thiamine phosphate synthase YjbQ (UPF0047 family)
MSIEDKVKESDVQLGRTMMATEKKSCACIFISDFNPHSLKDIFECIFSD